jgi:hypothetical protein
MRLLLAFLEWLAAALRKPELQPEDERATRDVCPDCGGLGMVESLGPTACQRCAGGK